MTEIFNRGGDNPTAGFASADDIEFRLSATDSGPMVEKFWGAEDYEFSTAVRRSDFGSLHIALSREFFADADGVRSFRAICEKHGVEHRNDYWTS
ncbi:MAG: hypothetical protein ACK4NP_11330 [Parvularculaceae bacterium]